MREFNQDVDQLIEHLIEASGEFKDVYRTEKTTYHVKLAQDEDDFVTYDIEVPPMADVSLVNHLVLHKEEYPGPDQREEAVWKRMVSLAKGRDYPPGSVFVTPWGTYLVRDLIQL
jgi:hypothetical protein